MQEKNEIFFIILHIFIMLLVVGCWLLVVGLCFAFPIGK